MEYEKRTIRQRKLIDKASTQIAIDDDFIVPDSKPDVVRIIHQVGTVTFEEPVVSNHSVWAKGKLAFSLLYKSDREEKKIEVLHGKIPFQEKLFMDEVEDSAAVRLCYHLEDLTIVEINSRKLEVQAVIHIDAFAECNAKEEIVAQILPETQYEQRQVEKEVLDLLTAKKDILRARNEMMLPSTKPNIGQILWKMVQPRGLEVMLAEGGLQVSGDVQVDVLYRTIEQGETEWYHGAVPIQGFLECEGAKADDAFFLEWKDLEWEIETKSDIDGEARILGVDLSLGTYFEVYQSMRLKLLEDVFATHSQVNCKWRKAVLGRLLMRNHAKVRVAEQVSLSPGCENILQICSSEGSVEIEYCEKETQGVRIGGTVSVHILYVTAQDQIPIEHARAIVPFEQVVDIPALSENTMIRYQCGMEQLNVNLLEPTEYEVKAVVNLWVMAVENDAIATLQEATEAAYDMEQLASMPGILGHTMQEGESLWDLAKKCHVKVEEIEKANDISATSVKPGDKILVVKQLI